MAKTSLTEMAGELQAGAQALLERLDKAQTAAGELLGGVRQSEGELLEKEETARKARAEELRKERLMEMLASDQDLAVHVGGDDEETQPVAAEPSQIEPAAEISVRTEEKSEPKESERPKAAPEAEKPIASPASEQPKAAPEAEQPKAAPDAPAAASEPTQPQKKPTGGYEQHVISPTQGQDRRPRPQGTQTYDPNRPRQTYDPNRPRPQGTQTYDPNRPRQTYDPNRPRQTYDPTRRPQPGSQTFDPNRPRQGTQTYDPTRRPQPGSQTFDPNRPRPQQRGPARPGMGAPRTGGAAVTPPTIAQAGKETRAAFDPNKTAKTKPRDADKKTKNKKTIARETAPSAKNWEEDAPTGSRRPKRGGKQQVMQRPEPTVIEKAVITTEKVTIKELSERIGKPGAEIIKKLFLLGMPKTINDWIDFDTCELIASDFGIELEYKPPKSFEEKLSDTADDLDAPETLVSRPPVVTIMGHVDHGKTSLLDAIRNSSVTEGEAGGITQHIGAYTVHCKDRLITFIDTPGHEAFTSMRARGAQVTDIVILVVAADDGIMPQTVEAINHAKAAKVPIVVAINKMDRPEADPERVKQQLTEYELVAEEWGGETIIAPVSAKTRMGVDNLLEMVLLQADVLELKANPNRSAKGTIIEAKLDKGRGPIATVLVQNGTLHRGDMIVAGTAYGKVRAMTDDRGRAVNEAGPSMPVEVLGFSEVPSAGDTLNVAEVDKLSRQVAEERRDKMKEAQLKSKSMVSLDELFTQMKADELKELNVIVKADVQGSAEAVKQALEKLSNDEVRVRCIHGGVGAITGTDVMFASASNAIVIGFNVRPDSGARQLAERENVDMRTYRIIYQAIEDVQNAMKGLFKPVFKETELGRATVRETFKVSGVGTIAGAYVNEGKVARSAQIRVVRDGVVIHEGKILSLRRFKDDAKEVLTGYECGIGVENFNDLLVGDVIEAFIVEEVKRT